MKKAILVWMVCITVSMVYAGSLNPPAPPTTGTMKPLDAIEPRIPLSQTTTPGDAECLFRITQSGSYYLTGNIKVIEDKHAILINADHVTLDLNGFSLECSIKDFSETYFPWASGVKINPGSDDVEIRNGSIFGKTRMVPGKPPLQLPTYFYSFLNGILATNAPPDEVYSDRIRIIDVRIDGCRGSGIVLNGKSNTIESCTVSNNQQRGISVSDYSIIKKCIITCNNSGGISTGFGCLISGNICIKNQGVGIGTNSYSTISDNTVSENQRGIDVNMGCTVVGNSASYNSRSGIHASGNCLLDRNTAFNNDLSGGGDGNISVSSCTLGVNHAP